MELVQRFDHAVLAVRDLGRAIACYRSLGFEVHEGGRHEKHGTHNAIVRFGLDYLELLAVFDEVLAQRAGPNRQALLELLGRGEGPAGFALATGAIDALAARLRAAGVDAVGPAAMERRRPDGTLLSWRLLIPGGVSWRRPWPFFIQWDQSDRDRLALERPGRHPNGATGVARIVVAVSDLGRAVDLYTRELGVTVEPGDDRPDVGARRAIGRLGDGRVVELLAASGPGALRDVIEAEGEGLFEIVLSGDGGPRGSRLTIPPSDALGARLVIESSG